MEEDGIEEKTKEKRKREGSLKEITSGERGLMMFVPKAAPRTSPTEYYYVYWSGSELCFLIVLR